jgi:hypothetical protein
VKLFDQEFFEKLSSNVENIVLGNFDNVTHQIKEISSSCTQLLVDFCILIQDIIILNRSLPATLVETLQIDT